jgi:hypothetical protein
VDRRLGKASAKRVLVDEIAWMLHQYGSHHQGWTVKQLQQRHSFRWGYTWTPRLQPAATPTDQNRV